MCKYIIFDKSITDYYRNKKGAVVSFNTIEAAKKYMIKHNIIGEIIKLY